MCFSALPHGSIDHAISRNNADAGPARYPVCRNETCPKGRFLESDSEWKTVFRQGRWGTDAVGGINSLAVMVKQLDHRHRYLRWRPIDSSALQGARRHEAVCAYRIRPSGNLGGREGCDRRIPRTYQHGEGYEKSRDLLR